MIYHTNPGNCHTDKIAQAGARQARALGGCWLPGCQRGWGCFLWVPLWAHQGLSRWVGVGGVGVGREPILIEKKRKQLRESAQNLCQSHLQSI